MAGHLRRKRIAAQRLPHRPRAAAAQHPRQRGVGRHPSAWNARTRIVHAALEFGEAGGFGFFTTSDTGGFIPTIMPRHLHSSEQNPRSTVGRIFSSIFALAFITFGLFLREQVKPEPAVESGGDTEWERVACRIEEARVTSTRLTAIPSPPSSAFNRHGGREYESTSLFLQTRSHDDYTKR